MFQSCMTPIVFAADKHQFQSRKGPESIPYIIHPMQVAYTLISIAEVKDSEILIAALLHDTVEDTETTFAEIDARFGPRVAALVDEVTDDKTLAKEVRKQLQIDHAPHKSTGAALIKLADKLANLRDLSQSPPTSGKVPIDAYFISGPNCRR